jgi:hypothetical protein
VADTGIGAHTEIEEEYDLDSFLETFKNHTVRDMNLELVIRVLTEISQPRTTPQAKRRGRGRPSSKPGAPAPAFHALDAAFGEVSSEMLEKLKELKRELLFWSSRVREELEQEGAAPTPKKRRLREKKSTTDGPTPSQDLGGQRRTMSRTVSYARKHAWPGRRTATTAAAQSMPQILQESFFGDTSDMDVKNAIFTFLYQICVKLLLDDEAVWEPQMTLLRNLAMKRDNLVKNVLKLPLAEGKHVLMTVVGGGAIPAELESNKFLLSVARLGVWLRMVAVSVQPDIHEALKNDTECDNPERSCLAYLWMGFEDLVLTNWLSHLLIHPHSHISLHFDGVRVTKGMVQLVAQKLKEELYDEWPERDLTKFIEDAQKLIEVSDVSALDERAIDELVRRIPSRARSNAGLSVGYEEMDVVSKRGKVASLVEETSAGLKASPLDIFAGESEDYIKKHTGFTLEIKEKKRRYFLKEVAAAAADTKTADAVHNIYHSEGNCILMALRRLLGEDRSVPQTLEGLQEQGADGETKSLRSRSYKQCLQLFKTAILPATKINFAEVGSRWLIHCEKDRNVQFS